MRTIAIASLVLALASAGSASTDDAQDKKDVVKVVTDAYINGVHAKPDAAAMRRGFHPDFRMLVLTDGKMNAVTLDEWAARVERSATSTSPRPAIKAEFPQVEIAGTAASVRVEVFRDGKHTFTDYLLLYKFTDGWKIVSKSFYTHPR
jgi:ketosteroid isomerase-like protein